MNKTLSTLFFALTAGFSATAQIIYHDISPDTTVGTTKLDWYIPNLPTMASFTIFQQPSLAAPSVYITVHGPAGYGEVLYDAPAGLPAKLDEGQLISAASNWGVATDHALHKDGTGNWRTDATHKYLGLRFRKGLSGTGPWHYGWFRLSVHPGALSFTVEEWAYQDVAGTAIKAGEKGATVVTQQHTAGAPGMLTAPDHIRFSGLQHADYTVRITGMNGQLLQTATVRPEDPVLTTAGLAPGIYAVELLCAGQCHRFKMALY
jgi:hypothetical protein